MSFFSRKRQFTPALPAGLLIYAIGDIHGRIDLFEALLEDIRRDAAGRSVPPLIILLGDLIDRGPDSAAVVRRAMEPLGWAALRALKGNHEAAMLDALDGERAMLSIWLRNGGDAALRSWGMDETVLIDGTSEEIMEAARAAIPRTERAWLARCPVNIQFGDYYFVHAGVRPGIKLADQREKDNIWIREEFLDSDRHHGAMVVHGHSVSSEIDERSNRIGIDTGAYASGHLTALALEGSSRWIIQT